MARIKDEDVVAVRDRARIDEVAREYVTLRSAGGGSFKGLCPFHDERTPSFHVTPSKGLYHCFSCQEGGDVITFVRKVDNLTFSEAVEKLAAKYGIQLRYEEGSVRPDRDKGQRTRLVEAHAAAATFYRSQLRTDAAATARAFLQERGFDEAAWDHFGVGFAPRGWDGLTGHLRAAGFTDAELLAGGLVAQGNRGVYDRFRGRLVWPIRDVGGDTIGFGARKLFDDDEGPKYLNTPETPIYRKSTVLYGVDLARREIAKRQQVVVVEGYTDVMACHLSGITTAVATCGTAFGAEHIKVLRRLLLDTADSTAQVIFTFDGDAAGQKAALRAFTDEQRFVSQTFVAIEPNGLDPCDLRQQHGPAAVQALIDARVPMFEFVIKSALAKHDLSTPDGRVAALKEAAPVIASIRDTALRPEYARTAAGWLGLDVEAVRAAVDAASRRPQQGSAASTATSTATGATSARPERLDPSVAVERELLSCVLQAPQVLGEWYASVESTAYVIEEHQAIHRAIVAAGGPTAAQDDATWVEAILAGVPTDDIRAIVRGLAVRPMPVDDPDPRYGTSLVARLLELDAVRQIAALRSQVQREEAQGGDVSAAMGRLMALEQYRRSLREQVFGQ